MSKPNRPADKNLLKKAEEFAKIAHFGRRRKTGEAEINHSLRIKRYLEEAGVRDQTTLAAGILHDVVKTGVSREEVEKDFGPEVASLVNTLTKISLISFPFKENSQATAGRLHRLFISLAKDIRVLLIRLADRVDNIKTAAGLPEKDQRWLAKKAVVLYAPLAEAIGVYAWARELNDKSLKIRQPERWRQINLFIEQKFKNADQDLREAEKEITAHLTKINKTGFTISFRKKSIASTGRKAYHKYTKGEISSIDSFDQLYDILGIRILVQDVKTCYEVLDFVHRRWREIPEEFDDYIANPKPNGYRSLQTAVFLKPGLTSEVQIRTFKMHQFNEYGPASHFTYKHKKRGGVRPQSAAWIKRLVSLKEDLAQELAGGSQKIRLFEDKMFVLTPKGDLVVLPPNSTPVDFAYALHSQIGDRCAGAKIDGRMVRLNTPLKSGQTVEIITQKNASPSAKWLEFVQTGEAKRKIRKSLAGKI